MSDKSKKPALRFKGFNDDWEQCELKKVVNKYNNLRIPIVSHLRVSGDTPYYGANGIQDYVKGYTHNGEYVLIAEDGANDLDNYPVRYVNGRIWVNNHAHVLQGINGIVDNKFLAFCFGRLDLKQFLVGGSRAKLNANVMMNIHLIIPTFKEQEKIGNYFKSLDNLITLHQRKLEKLENIKKSMLEKMFLKNNEKYPEIRFKGFTDAWEQCKLGDICYSLDYGLNMASKKYDGVNKYLRITDIDDNSRKFIKKMLTSPKGNLDNVTDYLLKEGDIVFARTGASVGKTYIYDKGDGIVYFAGFLIRAKIRKNCNPDFVFYNTLTENYKRFVKITSQRSGQPGINSKEYSEYKMLKPVLIREQEKIGNYLKSLDNLITLHQRKLEKLQNIKKSMLEKMFV